MSIRQKCPWKNCKWGGPILSSGIFVVVCMYIMYVYGCERGRERCKVCFVSVRGVGGLLRWEKNIRVRYWGLLILGDRRTRIMNDLYQVNTNKLSTNLYVIRDMPWIPRELQRALKLSHLNTILYSKNSISSSPYFTKNIYMCIFFLTFLL